MTSYEMLIACEKLGAHTIEIKESDLLLENPMEGVADSMEDGNVRCWVGADDGSDDCTLTPEEFSARYKITVAIFSD